MVSVVAVCRNLRLAHGMQNTSLAYLYPQAQSITCLL